MFFFRGGQAIMIRSKLTTKARTAIPPRVCAALGLKAGDVLVYEIVRRRVILSKAGCAGGAGDPFRAFHEWRSEADAKAYGKL